jgi:RNA polymerase sigma factor (sigma-70 family)
MADGPPVTDLLLAWTRGDGGALDALIPVLEAELRRLARIYRSRERQRGVRALDRALATLAAADPRKAQVIEMRFFAGMTVEETAVALHVSPDTVMRDWRLARLWLHRELDWVAS